MTKEIFTKNKSDLIELINYWLTFDEIRTEDKEALKSLLDILGQYLFENRLQLKGTLSHTIIDSMELDYALGKKFLQFDDAII